MYKVIVADNFHYMDESESYTSGEFSTLEEAIVKCKKIVNRFLKSAYQSGMSSEELYESYTLFGDDPYIATENVFSAWTYAKKRCVQICASKRKT